MDESKAGAIPTTRLWLGDHLCRYIRVQESDDVAPCKAAFPEADVVSSAEYGRVS